ncbi:AbrB/MazE/SpoVT family DNA-binding domain-containing protein [Scytonema sp. NUACC21]
MTTTVTKWGNSLAVRIPRALAEQVKIQEGTEVTLSISDNSIVITPKRRKKYTLDELLEGMTPENFHSEIDTGVAMGNEIW